MDANLSSNLYLAEEILFLGGSLLIESLLTGGLGAAFLGMIRLVEVRSNSTTSSSLPEDSCGRDKTEVRDRFCKARDISLSRGDSSSTAVELNVLE